MNEIRRGRAGASGLFLIILPFAAVVVAEVVLLMYVSSLIGWWTLAVLAVTMVLGLWLTQREWAKAWSGLAESLRTGTLPPGRMADAILILVGGMLLIMPGFLTDALGLLLLLPFTRPLVRSGIGWWAGRAMRPAGGAAPGPHGQVVEGEVVDEPAGEGGGGGGADARGPGIVRGEVEPPDTDDAH